jgi:hypothetical protein
MNNSTSTRIGDMDPLAWLFLYYKALCLNDTYRNFCISTRDSDIRKVESLLKENHLLLTFYKLFGDLSANYDNVNEQDQFANWLRHYGKNFIPARYKQFDLVNAGESIVPQEGVVYFTLPADASKDAARLFYSDLLVAAVKDIDESTEDRFLPLTQLKWNSRGRIDSTRKKLDAYYWAVYEIKHNGAEERDIREVIDLAADSGKGHWKPLKSTLDQLVLEAEARHKANSSTKDGLSRTELDSLQTNFSRDIKKSKAIVDNAAKGFFPSPKNHSKKADNILQGFDKNNIAALFD